MNVRRLWRGGRNRRPGGWWTPTRILELSFFLYQQPLLHLLLTLDAVRCPGNRVEPLDLNIVAAVYALAVSAFGDSIERLFDQPECVSLIRALREEKFLRV